MEFIVSWLYAYANIFVLLVWQRSYVKGKSKHFYVLFELIICLKSLELDLKSVCSNFPLEHLFSNVQSAEVSSAIYEMDWPMLSTDLMKTLLIIIVRSKKPIIITSGYIVTLSNESFMKVNILIMLNIF